MSLSYKFKPISFFLQGVNSDNDFIELTTILLYIYLSFQVVSKHDVNAWTEDDVVSNQYKDFCQQSFTVCNYSHNIVTRFV